MLVVHAAFTEVSTLLLWIYPGLVSDSAFKWNMANWGMTVLTHISEGIFEYQDNSGDMDAALQTVVAMDYTIYGSRLIYAITSSTWFLTSLHDFLFSIPIIGSSIHLIAGIMGLAVSLIGVIISSPFKMVDNLFEDIAVGFNNMSTKIDSLI